MAEYIEKAELIKKLCFETAEWYYSPTIKTIKEFPATDIQSVKHGRWELTDNPSFRKCSECGAWRSSDITDNYFTNYCPKCGVRMDTEPDEPWQSE